GILNGVETAVIGCGERKQQIGPDVLVDQLNFQSADACAHCVVDASGHHEFWRELRTHRSVDGYRGRRIDDAAGRKIMLTLELLDDRECCRPELRGAALGVGNDEIEQRELCVEQAHVVAGESLLEVASLQIHGGLLWLVSRLTQLERKRLSWLINSDWSRR